MVVAPPYLATTLPMGHASSSIGPLTLVLALGLAPMMGRAFAAGPRALLLATLFGLGASASYFGWHVVFEVIAPSINTGLTESTLKWQIVIGALGFLFIVQTILQTRPNGRLANWLQPHLLSGLYIDDWFTRMTFRLFPPGLR
jgi:NAD(P)H-quinone oxidoreductase subunit 5